MPSDYGSPMRNLRMPLFAVLCGFLCGLSTAASAQSPVNYAVQVSASVQTSPPQIVLAWPADRGASGYTVYRKAIGAATWGNSLASLGADSISYADANVVVGSNYEYRLSKAASGYSGEGYVYAGIQTPLVDSRGKIVLLVDSTQSSSLSNELARLQQDLVGDGWTVLRHDVAREAVDPANTNSSVWTARSNELANAKTLVRNDYNADPANVVAVFLIGHLPVPYSGSIAPDGHIPQHSGAWPADGYYADVPYDMYTWYDTLVSNTGAADTRNWNVPDDGKFDPSIWPIPLTLQVGRVDLANLPSFSLSETELLRQYLNKDHNFRAKLITAQRSGWIDDNFGMSTGEPLAVTGWRNFAAFFGASNTVAGSDWFGTLATNSCLWGYGNGAGTCTSSSGVGATSDFAANAPQVVFTMFFGSYFGDWDSQDNFLRAGLASPGYTLTSVWSGRPYWQFHHMAMGQTIGFSTLVSQNNIGVAQGGYDFNTDDGFIHVALMGDPTLRLHPLAPPAALIAATDAAGGTSLTWTPSPDPVLGYLVYSAPTAVGPFTRLTPSLITGTSYNDPVNISNVYMVRAVNLELSASGTYTNASQGIFQSLNTAAIAPNTILLQPTSNTLFTISCDIPLTASVFDPANAFTNIVFYANGVPIGQATSPLPYTTTWSNVQAGPYSLTAGGTSPGGVMTLSSPVNILVVGPSPILTITSLGTGSYAISGIGIPGSTNRIEFALDPTSPDWQTLGTVQAGSSGSFQLIDSTVSAQRYYRSVSP
jgi:hypothetical protein